MKGNPEVLGGLNEALREELTAINQYFVHAEMFENWGYKKLSELSKKQSIDEMKHAEALIERILFLEGTPEMRYSTLNVGKTVPEMIDNDHKLELGAVELYNRLVKMACAQNDHGTEQLFKQLLKDEEGHVDKLEEQQDEMRDMGLQVYLSAKL
jgi:bacterioferritin